MFNQSIMKNTWREFKTCLKEVAPAALHTLRGSACTCSVFRLQITVGKSIPEDFKQFLFVHDGQIANGNDYPYICKEGRLLPVAEMIDTWKMLSEMDVSTTAWDKKFLPFAKIGEDYTCIDLNSGEIISIIDKTNEKKTIANDFQSWFLDKLFVLKQSSTSGDNFLRKN